MPADLSSLVPERSRHASQGRELVTRRFALGPRQLRKQRRLTDGRKPDKPDARVAGLGDLLQDDFDYFLWFGNSKY